MSTHVMKTIARTLGMVLLLSPVGSLKAQEQPRPESPPASEAPPPRPDAAPSDTTRQAAPSAQPVPGKLDVQLEPVAEDAVRIRAIRPGGAADRAGVRVGDILLQIDGASLSEPQQAATALQGKAPGDQVTMTILRDGLRQQVPVVLSAGTSAAQPPRTSAGPPPRPAPLPGEPQRPPLREPGADATPEQQGRSVPPEAEQGQMVEVKGGWLGVAVEPGGENIKGLRVVRVFPSGPAARAGIRKDAVLLSVEGQPLYQPEDLSRALEGTQPGQVVTVTLVQGPAATPVEKQVSVRLGDTSRIARRPILPGDEGEQERPDSYTYWEDSQGFATQIPHAAVELEFQRRLAEQNERIERLLISLQEEINALREEVAALKAAP